MSSRILIIEDEAGIVRVITDLLRSVGHAVDTARDGKSGLQRLVETEFHLVILDLLLPGIDGMEVCRNAREQGFDGAILMLTARSELHDRVKGLQIGADDYLVKPFNSEELLARVTALLRRVHKSELTPVSRIVFGSVIADFAHGEISRDGLPLALTAKETELLRLLINHRGQVLTREKILKQVWKEQPFITQRTVDVHIAWLRQKLEENPQAPRHIPTARGEGYWFSR